LHSYVWIGENEKKLIYQIVQGRYGRSRVDDQVLDNVEEALIASDVGVDTTLRIIERLEERVQPR